MEGLWRVSENGFFKASERLLVSDKPPPVHPDMYWITWIIIASVADVYRASRTFSDTDKRPPGLVNIRQRA